MFGTGVLILGLTGIVSIIKGQFYDLSWYFLSTASPEILNEPIINPPLQLDTVMVGTMRVSGPISSNSLQLIQFHLENNALLENLAISPIGNLWEIPIV
jgi:hypothetical protein